MARSNRLGIVLRYTPCTEMHAVQYRRNLLGMTGNWLIWLRFRFDNTPLGKFHTLQDRPSTSVLHGKIDQPQCRQETGVQ